jgi:hypothetical protein
VVRRRRSDESRNAHSDTGQHAEEHAGATIDTGPAGRESTGFVGHDELA